MGVEAGEEGIGVLLDALRQGLFSSGGMRESQIPCFFLSAR